MLSRIPDTPATPPMPPVNPSSRSAFGEGDRVAGLPEVFAGVDFETSGLSPQDDVIIEAGCELYEWGLPCLTFSELWTMPSDLPLPEVLVRKLKITDAMLQKYGLDREEGAHRLHAMVSRADAVVAHNGAHFDRRFWNELCQTYRLDPLSDMLWIDTMHDLPYPEEIETRKLEFLAAAHDFLNPFSHRALSDVRTTMKIFLRYDLAEVVRSARQPFVKCIARVSRENKDLAKGQRYRWNPNPSGRGGTWEKEVKAHRVREEREKCQAAGFEILTSEDETFL